MYCPLCKSEYIDGIKICKDCEAKLVTELEAEPDLTAPLKNRLIFFKTYSSVILGELDRSYLEAEGIHCFLLNKNASRMHAMVGDLFDSILMVEQNQYDKALELIQNRTETENSSE